tara:strand:+ start:913 stop:1584 length:672 start_codon:yes stop_codon:yes gene_type:complete
MDKINEILNSNQFTEDPISLILLNLILCMILVSIVSWFYKKFSQSLGGKTHIGSILPLIGLTVFLVITIVKSSLALSLGLVGALSIVRFRTPIKEPEELGYLFLTIGVGLGFGAGFKFTTIIITSAILLYLYFKAEKKDQKSMKGEYTISITINNSSYNKCCNLIRESTIASKIIRTETIESKTTVYFNVSLDPEFDLQNLIDKLKLVDKESRIEFVETGVNW